MASSSSPSDPAFSSQSWNHDVFLSFRGKDTRKTFVDHLYSALVLQGIDTYKDDETLPRGESISPTLMKAIEESQIAVIVFSENYAESSWCLDELAHVMKCEGMTGQIVMPIFYDVDPSEVRKQKGKYGIAFAKHDLENKNKVESWRKALVDASNLSGWEPKHIANGHESKAIKEIVYKISSRLQLVTASANEKLIGIAARVQRLRSELQIGSGGVRMIGVWGVGGGGKTTLASCIYDEICGKFDGCCFIANIREQSSTHGLETLQEKILSKLEANNIGGGRCLISKRLRSRKVLIVLDDVDHLDQLKSLAGSPDWFGEGSRIIITTRDEHIIKAHRVVVHDISLLQGDEAIKLFHKHAFRGCLPTKDYEQLSEEVISRAGGLPLALIVLGSSLCDKNIHQWRSALARLKVIPDKEILEKLKISFDGLTKVQKDLFLDIACFFRWESGDRAMKILDAFGFYPVIGVEELRQKALITISNGIFDMHDLVQEMGHYIVRGEHPKNPEKHSRVWKKEDVITICAMDATMELDKIEAIKVGRHDFIGHKPLRLVANMRNLRYLDWNGDLANPLIKNFPQRGLCCLNWKGDLANPLIKNFPQRGLCCLVLYKAIGMQLWNGYKVLPNLKIMELNKLENLRMTPNFDGTPYLERLLLNCCPELEEIHSSLGGLQRLVLLSIVECKGIKKFPSITRLKKLETLSFRLCPGLIEVSEIQQKMVNLGDEDMKFAVWELPNLQELDLSYNNFPRLNFSLIRAPRLKNLYVSGCKFLVELSGLPSSIAVLEAENCISLKTFGDTSNCKWLWRVSLVGSHRVSPHDGYKLLNYMFKGNAIEDHLISISLPHRIPKWFVGGLMRGSAFTLRLPHDWYNNFCGFSIHIVTREKYPAIHITIKHKVNGYSTFQLWRESNEELEYGLGKTYVGYVSFNILRRRAGCLDSTYNAILISLFQPGFISGAEDRIGAQLVPWKSKDYQVQTTKVATDYSEFWDESVWPFIINHGSKSSREIRWHPNIS